MTKAPEDAIEKVRKLPDDRQAYVAEVLEGLEQAERGEFVSDDKMAALRRKCGL